MSVNHGKARFVTPRRWTLRQFGYCITVLLCLTSMAIPAYAQEGALPSAALAALAASGPCTPAQATAASADETIVMPASPQAPVTIPKTVVNRAVFNAYWRNSVTDAEAVESLMQSLFLMAGAGGALAQLTASARQSIPLAELDDRVKHPLDEIVYVYLNAALAIPDLVPHVPAVWDTINSLAPRDDVAGDTSLLVAQSAQRHDQGERMLQNAQEFMTAIHNCAGQSAPFAAQFDALHAQRLNAGIRDNASAILQKNAGFVLPALLVQSLQPDGTALLSLDQVNAMGAGALNVLDATMDEMVATAKEIDKSQTGIVEFNNDQQKKEAAQKLAKEKAEKTEKQFKDAQSAINASATILERLDPKLAKQFKTITSSYLDIVKSVNTWLEATTGLGSLDKIFSLSTVVMTGDVIGAVMKIVSLFGDSKPSPEEQILQEIGKLRQQVKQLRQEMHARFDRIDAQLNAIFTTMQERFDQVDIQLGRINGNIRDVQRSLIELDLRLSQFERNNFELLNVLGRRPLLDAINSGLDYQRVTGTAMPFQPEFVGFERTFHTWGTVHAFDPLNTGPTQRDLSDGALYHELTTYPLDTNLNYLNSWLTAHGLPAIAAGMLASPRDWLLASRAYTQLGAEWPEHMARIDPAELTELIAVGQQLEQAITNITAPSEVTAAGDSVFDVVAALYSNKMAQLNSGLLQIENSYLEELRAARLDPSVPFDLFGGTEQELLTGPGSPNLWMPPGYSKVELVDESGFMVLAPNLSVPLSIQGLVSPMKHHRLAELLKLQPQTRITVQVTAVSQGTFPCNLPKPGQCVDPYDLTFVFNLRLGFLSWRTLQAKLEDRLIRRNETVTDHVVANWETLKPLIDQNLVDVPLSPDQQQQVNARFTNLKGSLDARLQNDQQVLYARMFDQMSSGTLHPLMVEIAGVKALLDAFTSLGLPRAVANDEFLHAILFGEQRIFDDSLIVSTFALSATQPITGPALLVSQRPLLMERAAARIQLYIQLVDGYLAAIANGQGVAAANLTAVAEGSHAEGADYLANARRALDLTVRIARIPRPQTPVPPGGSLHVYLPLVDR